MAVAVSADGRRVAAGGGIAGGKGAVHAWDAATGAAQWSADDCAKEVLALAFSPDGASLAAAAPDGVVTVRDAATGSVARSLPDHRGGATAVTFSPDGNALYCGEAHGGTRVWDLRTGRLLRTIEVPRPTAQGFTVDRLMNSVALSGDGATLAACASSVNDEFVGAVRIWDARTGKLRRDFSPDAEREPIVEPCQDR